MNSFEELKNQIRDRESHRERVVREYEAAIAVIDQDIVKLKVELANLVLSEQTAPEEKADLVTLVGIQFNGEGKIYDYFWDSDDPVEVGNRIDVESTGGRILRGVQVVEIKRLELESLELSNYKNAYPLGTC